MEHPKLRDSKKLVTNEIYPINEMPDDIIVRIGGYLVYLLYIGRKDITGSDWGDAFADAIGGTHLDSPVGIADVVFGKMGINIAQDNYNPVRTTVLIRSNDMLNYCLFEEDNHRFRTSDYEWEENTNGNLVGKDKNSSETCFTWQPHGSQFTIHTKVPENAVKFTIKRPPMLTKEDILKTIEFDSSWISIIK